jgi:iron-sulfur cluster insertion protein
MATVEKPTSTDEITLTARAADKVVEFAEGEALLRVGVQGGGCGGFQYQLGIAPSIEAGDLVFATPRDDVKLVVDPMFLPYLKGASVDFVSGLNLADSGFKIDNPNAASSCGCGSSFRVDEDDCPSTTDDSVYS